MTEKRKRRVYEPPIVRNLSVFSAKGGSPQGNCSAGPFPWYDCRLGTTHALTDCLAGDLGDSSFCDVGFYDTRPACQSPGLSAATICDSGGAQQ